MLRFTLDQFIHGIR